MLRLRHLKQNQQKQERPTAAGVFVAIYYTDFTRI